MRSPVGRRALGIMIVCILLASILGGTGFSQAFADSPPVANAGLDQIVNEGDTVTLDGTGSTDPDGDQLTFSWIQTAGPPVTLSGANTTTGSFTAPQVGLNDATLTFELTVSDGSSSATDTVDVTVKNLVGYHYFPSFNATGSNFYDVQDSPTLRLNNFALASWFNTTKNYNKEPGFIVNKGGFGNPTPGIYLNYGIWVAYQSDVRNKIGAGFKDSSGAGYYVYSKNTVNDGKWHYVVVTFDGSFLRLYIDGVLDNTSSKLTKTPDSSGTKPLRIGADSQLGTSATRPSYFNGSIDEVRVWNRVVSASEVSDQYGYGISDPSGQLFYMDGMNGSPITIAGPNQIVSTNNLVTLDGSQSFDPDPGDQLTYSWMQTSGPTVTLSDPNAATPTFTSPNAASTVKFSLTVSDGKLNSTGNVVITVTNGGGGGGYQFAPSYNLEGKQYFEVNDSAASEGRTAFSVGIWFNTVVKPTTNAYLAAKGGPDNGANMNYGIWLDSSAKLKGGFKTSSGSIVSTVATTKTYNDGKWHYALMTYDGATLKLYVDGDAEIKQPSGSYGKPDTSSSSHVRIGAHGNINDKYFTGEVDELYIWSTALTSNDVKDQYYSGKYDQPNLVYYTNMGDVPKANAGPLQLVPGGTQVILNGTRSSGDPNNGPLTYQWSGPVSITDSDKDIASATVPLPPSGDGEKSFIFLLKVSDIKYTATNTVQVVSYDPTKTSTVLRTPRYTPTDRIGIKYPAGTSSNYIEVKISEPSSTFDGRNSYLVYCTQTSCNNSANNKPWVSASTSEPDLYMNLSKQSIPVMSGLTTCNPGCSTKLYSGFRIIAAEYVSSTSALVGKDIDSITLSIRKVGSPTGTAEIGIFNRDGSVKNSFGTIDVSALTTTFTSMTFNSGTYTIISEPKYKDELLASIRNAQKYVYVSMYFVCVDYCGSNTSVYDNDIINALATRLQENPSLDVKLIFPQQTLDQYKNKFVTELEAKGFVNATKNPTCKGGCYKVSSTHAKVVAIDDNVTYVGSANWNDMGLDNNWDVTVKTTNPNMIKDAKNYVLWNWGSGSRPNNVFYYERFVSGIQYNNLLMESLKNAKTVKALMFEVTYQASTPTSPDTLVVNELKNAYLRGTNLQLLWDDPRYCLTTTGRSAQDFFYKNGMQTMIDPVNAGIYQRQHAKSVLIDDSILFIGSHNWNQDSLGSASSPGSVLEASIVTRNPQAVSDYLNIFNARWAEGKPTWTVKANADDNDREPCRDFSMSASQSSLNVVKGSSAGSSTTISITTWGTKYFLASCNCDTQAVQFNVSLSSSPSISGVTASFNPGFVITPSIDPGTKTSILTIKADTSAVPGTYTLTIKGIGIPTGSVGTQRTHAITLTLTIS